MRVAFLIPHVFSAAHDASAHGSERSAARTIRTIVLDRVLFQLRTLFGPIYHAMNSLDSKDYGRTLALYPADNPHRLDFEIFVFTTGGLHLLGGLQRSEGLYQHVESDAEPRFVGFECARWIRDHIGTYDFFCYLEDDILIRDPLFFIKIRRFNQSFGAGEHGLILQPQRYEETLHAGDPDHFSRITRLYIDYQSQRSSSFAGARLRLDFAELSFDFEPALNPSAGCYVVDNAQAELMARHPEFLDRTKIHITPMDTAASAFVARALKVYKPALGSLPFLDVQHGHQGVMRSHFEPE